MLLEEDELAGLEDMIDSLALVRELGQELEEAPVLAMIPALSLLVLALEFGRIFVQSVVPEEDCESELTTSPEFELMSRLCDIPELLDPVASALVEGTTSVALLPGGPFSGIVAGDLESVVLEGVEVEDPVDSLDTPPSNWLVGLFSEL